jgi:hypothetical protein
MQITRNLVLTGLAVLLSACGTGSSSRDDVTAAPVTLDPAFGEVFTPGSPPVGQTAYLTAAAAYATAFPRHPAIPLDGAVAFGHFTMMLGPTGSPSNTYKANSVAAWGFSQPGCLPEGGNLPVRPGGSAPATDSPSRETSSDATDICMLWSIVDASDGHLIDMTNQQVP